MSRTRLILVILSGLCTLVLLPIATNIATGDLPEWAEPHIRLAWPAVGVFSVIAIGLLIFEVKSNQSADGVQAAVASGQADLNRNRMLEIVRQTWIDGYLKHSLENLARIELGLETKPDAISRPGDVIVQQPDRSPRPLPPGQAMGAVFDELGQALLILGAPGAGKTTLLLELARDRLDRAEQDASYPIPVVFHLSSWAVRRRPLTDWLVDELAERYYIPRKLARTWINAEQILPLLDGLDEVALEQRAECVEAINAFRQEHGLVPLAVCCRKADYEALPTRVELSGAVAIEPLSRAQVSTYLKQAGKPLAGVRTALRDDETLWELLDTPLMLSIVALAYRGRSATEVRATGTLEERRAHLFAAYTRAMFERRTVVTEYTREQTIHWLVWLARSLVSNSQSVFYVEWMQPDWLPSRAQRRVVAMMPIMVVRLVFGLFFGLFFGLAGGLVAGLAGGLVAGLAGGLVGGLFSGLAGGLVGGLFSGLAGGLVSGGLDHITPAEELRWSWRRARSHWSIGLRAGLVFGLFFGLFFGLVGVLVGGLAGGLAFELVATRTIPNEGIRRSLRNALISFLIAGLVGGLFFGLVGGLVGGLNAGLAGGLVAALAFGLQIGGFAYLQHYVLRFLLWRNDYAPWNYTRFLEYAAERVFLRKVGGGYIFTHRLLMEYFASLEPIEQAKAE